MTFWRALCVAALAATAAMAISAQAATPASPVRVTGGAIAGTATDGLNIF